MAIRKESSSRKYEDDQYQRSRGKEKQYFSSKAEDHHGKYNFEG